MADSDNTTTLPHVTRRRLLAGTAIAVAKWRPRAFARSGSAADQSDDPAVAAWHQWMAVYDQVERLCCNQQRLERQLVERVGFPGASVYLRQRFDEPVDPAPRHVAARTTVELQLVAHQERWDAADKDVGYSAALLAEREAADRAEDLLEVLFETPAASLAGVAVKLDAVLREGQPSDDDAEFPWPQIRSAFEDIRRIIRLTKPS